METPVWWNPSQFNRNCPKKVFWNCIEFCPSFLPVAVMKLWQKQLQGQKGLFQIAVPGTVCCCRKSEPQEPEAASQMTSKTKSRRQWMNPCVFTLSWTLVRSHTAQDSLPREWHHSQGASRPTLMNIRSFLIDIPTVPHCDSLPRWF